MPVLREDQEQRTGRRGRRWLWLLAVPPTLVLLLLAGALYFAPGFTVSVEPYGYRGIRPTVLDTIPQGLAWYDSPADTPKGYRCWTLQIGATPYAVERWPKSAKMF